MYLEQVRFKNIACFDDLTLDFTEDGEPCKWVVVLGENGSGKSTLLQMLALSLIGSNMINEIAGGVDWTRFVTNSSSKGHIETNLRGERMTGVRALCDSTFFDKLTGHAKVVEAYERWQAGQMPLAWAVTSALQCGQVMINGGFSNSVAGTSL